MLTEIAFSEADEAAPVLSIGAAALDVIGKATTLDASGSSQPAEIRTSFGGIARNLSENLARLGCAAQLLSVLGNDSNGQALLQHTATAGVDIRPVLRTAAFPTAFYMGIVDAEGQLRLGLHDMRILQMLNTAALHAANAYFRRARLLFLDANLSPAALRTAFSLARKAKIPVVADPASTLLAPRLQRYLPRITLLTLNRLEAAALLNTSPPASQPAALQMARQLVEQGVTTVIMALGEAGVIYASAETTGFVPALRVQVTDWTGAGDAMTAAVLYGLLNAMPLDEAVRLGVAAAAITLQYPGSVHPHISEEMLYESLSL